MVLGAGIYQVPLIKKAKEMGLEVVVVSLNGDYPGIDEGDIYLEIDTTNIKQIVRAAREYSILGIATTGTDVSIPAIGAVNDLLGLIGPNREIANTVSSKIAFRSFQRKHDLNCPVFKGCTSAQEAWDFYKRLNDKVVFKPDDSSGSRGVTILDSGLSEENVKEAYDNALKYSRNGLVCSEEFIDGLEVGGDGFFLYGYPQAFIITCKHMDDLIVQGHSLPSKLSEEVRLVVMKEIYDIVSKLGYDAGPVNFDVIINDKGPKVLELGIRNGGNGIVDLIYHTEGIDLMEWLLTYILEKEYPKNRQTEGLAYSSYVFGSPNAGRLDSVTSFEELKTAVPDVYKLILAKKRGSHIEPFINNSNLVGYLLLQCDATAYNKVVAQVQEKLQVRVSK